MAPFFVHIMANFGTWNKNMPSGSSSIQHGDDLLRSDKSVLEATLNTEHYFSGDTLSAASAGVHRLGSARVFVGSSSAVSGVGHEGRLMYATDTQDLHYLGVGAGDTIRYSNRTANDLRYVRTSGSTMTGALVMDGDGADIRGAALSGNLHVGSTKTALYLNWHERGSAGAEVVIGNGNSVEVMRIGASRVTYNGYTMSFVTRSATTPATGVEGMIWCRAS